MMRASKVEMAPVLEAPNQMVALTVESMPAEKEAIVNEVFGARASYIANTLLTDSEQLHYFCIWLVVFAIVIFGLHKLMKSTMTSK